MVEAEEKAKIQAQQIQLPHEFLERTDFNKAQKKALAIIKELEATPEQRDLLFVYHLFHEKGSLDAVRNVTGIKKTKEISGLISRFLEDDELVEKYDIFYNRYKEELPDRE